MHFRTELTEDTWRIVNLKLIISHRLNIPDNKSNNNNHIKLNRPVIRANFPIRICDISVTDKLRQTINCKTFITKRYLIQDYNQR